MSTYNEELAKCQNLLKDANIAEYQSDAAILFEFVTGLRRQDLFVKGNDVMPNQMKVRLDEATKKRLSNIPVQYITGIQNFMGYDFIVNENVLIPRFDTEILVENVLKEAGSLKRETRILDICTGSGCIIISLLLNLKNAVGVATDISDEALAVAENNRQKHGISNLNYINTDLVDGVFGEFDIIVSNPPYIESKVVDELDATVKDHEPRLALDGGVDGLIFYRRLVDEAIKLLAPGGFIAVEIGYNQGIQVKGLFENAGLEQVKIVKDYAGLDRVVMGRYCE